MKLRIIPLLAALLLPAVLHGQARDDQFKRDAFSQNYDDTTKQAKTDSSKLFSFRQYFGSLAHKRPGQVQNLFMGSTVFVGGGQIYNRQYWKLPVVYGGIGAGIGMGIHFNNQYKATGTSGSSSTAPGPMSGPVSSGGHPSSTLPPVSSRTCTPIPARRPSIPS